MKRMKLLTRTTTVFLFFITGCTAACFSKSKNSESKPLTRGGIEKEFARQMSILNYFDSRYHEAIRQKYLPGTTILENSQKHAEETLRLDGKTRSSDGATITVQGEVFKWVEGRSPDVEVNNYKQEFHDYQYHFVYFANPQPSKEEAFANAYIAYLSFWLSINFRVCALFCNEMNPMFDLKTSETGDLCNTLATYFQWFTFVQFPKKMSGYVYKVAASMSTFDLDFVMTKSYLERKGGRNYPKGGIIRWKNVTPHISQGITFRTLFPMNSANRYFNYREDCYQYLYKKILSVLDHSITKIENFFHTVVTGQSIPKVNLTKTRLIPNFEISLEIWEQAKIFDYIRRFNPLEERRMYGQVRSPALRIFGKVGEKRFRSNPVEIIRNVLEIIAQSRIRLLPARAPETDDSPESEPETHPMLERIKSGGDSARSPSDHELPQGKQYSQLSEMSDELSENSSDSPHPTIPDISQLIDGSTFTLKYYPKLATDYVVQMKKKTDPRSE